MSLSAKVNDQTIGQAERMPILTSNIQFFQTKEKRLKSGQFGCEFRIIKRRQNTNFSTFHFKTVSHTNAFKNVFFFSKLSSTKLSTIARENIGEKKKWSITSNGSLRSESANCNPR